MENAEGGGIVSVSAQGICLYSHSVPSPQSPLQRFSTGVCKLKVVVQQVQWLSSKGIWLLFSSICVANNYVYVYKGTYMSFLYVYM